MTTKLITLATASLGALFATPTASAATFTFVLNGLTSSTDFAGAFPTLTHDFGTPGTVVSLTWEVNFSAQSPSWQSEAQIAIDTTVDSSADADLNPADYGAPDAAGVFTYSGTVTANTVSGDGLVYLTLYESFVDGVNPDAVYGPGSFVTVEYTPVPEPGSALLFLGAAVLGCTRRRRL